LIVLELHEIEIDYCPSCSGIWLDAGELELLLEDQVEREKIISSFHLDPDHPERPYRCPICRKKMDKVYVGDKKELLIDKCPYNDGIWFDKGELKDVLELGDKDNKVVELLSELFDTKLNSKQSGED